MNTPDHNAYVLYELGFTLLEVQYNICVLNGMKQLVILFFSPPTSVPYPPSSLTNQDILSKMLNTLRFFFLFAQGLCTQILLQNLNYLIEKIFKGTSNGSKIANNTS
jgi:hypothetical protein